MHLYINDLTDKKLIKIKNMAYFFNSLENMKFKLKLIKYDLFQKNRLNIIFRNY